MPTVEPSLVTGDTAMSTQPAFRPILSALSFTDLSLQFLEVHGRLV